MSRLTSRSFVRRLLAVWLVAAATAVVSAQNFRIRPRLELAPTAQLADVDNVARAHLERIDGFLDDGQWSEAVEALQGVMDTTKDGVIRAPGQTDGATDAFVRYVGFRHYCQQKIAALATEAPEALRLYRERVDPLARQWLDSGWERRDERLLRDVVELLFASSYGDDALLRLGDLWLERGLFTRARLAWQRLSPRLRSPDPGAVLAYPDTDHDLAAVRARLVALSILEGSLPRAGRELDALQAMAPDAEGVLGGRRGRYVDLLEDLLQNARSWSPPRESSDWTTFAGSATRERTSAETIDVALRPIWSVPLPRRAADDQLALDGFRAAERQEGLLSYHPLIVGGQVILTTGERIEDVCAFDARTGERLWPEVTPKPNDGNVTKRPAGVFADSASLPEIGVPRFTMTAHDNTLYVKLGSAATSHPLANRRMAPAQGYLAALDLEAQKKRLFEIHLDSPTWGSSWALEGAPVTDGRCLYIMLRRRDNVRHQAHVACFDMKRGRLQWRQFLAAADTLGQGQYIEFTHNLLTLDQGVLYCNTNLGAVAAVRAEDGQLQWVVRYPRCPASGGDPYRSLAHVYRDVTPCMVHKDLVFVAPGDSDRVFALDAGTGLLQWSTDAQTAVDVVHLLGVGQGHLLASGSRLYWIDVRDGEVLARFPARLEDDTRGYGRGLLAGDLVYWPTVGRIHVFQQSGPRRARQPIDLAPLGMRGGNLVLSDQLLLIAGSERLSAFDVRRDAVADASSEMPKAARSEPN